MQRSGLPFQQQKAAALELLGDMVAAQAQMLAFSDTFIVIAIVVLLVPIPAALLSRSQQHSPMLQEEERAIPSRRDAYQS